MSTFYVKCVASVENALGKQKAWAQKFRETGDWADCLIVEELLDMIVEVLGILDVEIGDKPELADAKRDYRELRTTSARLRKAYATLRLRDEMRRRDSGPAGL